MKKNYDILIVVGLVVFLPLIIFFITFSVNNKVEELDLNVYKSIRSNDECLFIQTNNKLAKKFSFDGGNTWQEEKEKFICSPKEKELLVKVKNERDKIIAEKLINISKVKDDNKITYIRINEKNERIDCTKNKVLIGFDYTVNINNLRDGFKVIDFKACNNCLSEKLVVADCEKIKNNLVVEVDSIKNSANIVIGGKRNNNITDLEITYKYESVKCKQDTLVSDLITRSNIDLNRLEYRLDNLLIANASIKNNQLVIGCSNIGKTKLHIMFQSELLKTIDIEVEK